MKRLVIGSIALLGLAGCNPGSGLQATVPTPAAPGPTTSTVSTNPPDNPTGSQRYQSPDLPRRYRPVGGY